MKKNCLFIIAIGISNMLVAQSYHFSQYYSTPLLINPAFTANINGPFRISSNFRSQWTDGGSPYFSASLSADFNFLKEKLPKGQKVGVGISLLNDKSLNGGLRTNALGLSMAYNLELNHDGQQSIGIGFQGTLQSRKIDYSKLSFENQFTSGGFDPLAPIGETLPGYTKSFFDLNTGIVYNLKLEEKAFFAGISVYNILHHKENIQDNEFKVSSRLTLQTGGQLSVGYSDNLYYSITHMNQAKANETTLGASYGFNLNDEANNELTVGLWYRIKDALFPYLGYQINSLQVGLSYDFTISSIKTTSTVRNGYELSLVYKASDKTALRKMIPWY